MPSEDGGLGRNKPQPMQNTSRSNRMMLGPTREQSVPEATLSSRAFFSVVGRQSVTIFSLSEIARPSVRATTGHLTFPEKSR
ncbi:LOW QUALITY PROTEIN: hypothetical protein IFM47457_07390 [Aspergillus lentulus]|nr:LOW QUALITY PROTEIN: hypothetical protein IFM47457_07390 [Aspergillus lentulus]